MQGCIGGEGLGLWIWLQCFASAGGEGVIWWWEKCQPFTPVRSLLCPSEEEEEERRGGERSLVIAGTHWMQGGNDGIMVRVAREEDS